MTQQEKTEKVEAQFLKDVAVHQMSVLQDDGVYRHLRFQQPESWVYEFDLVTWPGYLAFTGDMGCYVFSRVPDMFTFFREHEERKTDALHINEDYWAQKVIGEDRQDKVKAYSPEKFRGMVNERLTEYLGEEALTVDDINAVSEAVDDELLSLDEGGGEHGQMQAHEALRRFKHGGLKFEGSWEWDLTDYTSRFLWCCYAIVWGIRQYDKVHKEEIVKERAVEKPKVSEEVV